MPRKPGGAISTIGVGNGRLPETMIGSEVRDVAGEAAYCERASVRVGVCGGEGSSTSFVLNAGRVLDWSHLRLRVRCSNVVALLLP